MRIPSAASPFRPLLLSAALAVPLALPHAQDPTPAKPPAPAPAEPSDPAKEQKVRELLELTGAGRLGHTMMTQTLDGLRHTPGLPEGFVERFAELARPAELVELLVPVYVKHVSAGDLDALLAFWKTDVGKRWAAAQAPIMKDSMAAGEKWGAELGARVARELQQKRDGK